VESASIAATHEHEHHGPPEAHASSRIDRQTLGILLFIVSEVMLFGSFFAAYFFIRVVANVGPWPPEGLELPKAVAGVNTAILVSSSFTIHWALESIRRDNRRGLILGLAATFLLGATFLFIQINEYAHIGFAPHTNAFGSVFYGLTGLHGAHVTVGLLLLAFANIRVWRGHFSKEPKKHLGVEVSGIYWHFVDVMWIIVFTTVYILRSLRRPACVQGQARFSPPSGR
jgi:cytochrome c oxidase subunit 3